MRSFFIFLLLLCSLQHVFSGDVEQVFIEKANRAYAAGAYTEAAANYKKVVDMGYESPDLYFNLGNACFKMNDYAGAILWFERAHRLDPGNEAIDFNLKVANSKIADKIEPLPDLFYKRWYKGVVTLFSADTWAVSGIVLFSQHFCRVYSTSHPVCCFYVKLASGAESLLCFSPYCRSSSPGVAPP